MSWSHQVALCTRRHSVSDDQGSRLTGAREYRVLTFICFCCFLNTWLHLMLCIAPEHYTCQPESCLSDCVPVTSSSRRRPPGSRPARIFFFESVMAMTSADVDLYVVGIPAGLIFQPGWNTSWCQSLCLFLRGWDTSWFNLSTWLGHQLMQTCMFVDMRL